MSRVVKLEEVAGGRGGFSGYRISSGGNKAQVSNAQGERVRPA